jgi:hypothetical protein
MSQRRFLGLVAMGSVAALAGLFLIAPRTPDVSAAQKPIPAKGQKGKKDDKNEPKKVDPNVFVKPLVKQLFSHFTSWDENKDDGLDTTELAKAFRGPQAKPYDADKDTDRNSLPDYQFLVLVNKNSDAKISRKEYESWVKKYATLLEDVDDARQDYQKALDRLRSAKTAKSKQSAQVNLQKKTKELNDVLSQWNAIPPAIHKMLSVRK